MSAQCSQTKGCSQSAPMQDPDKFIEQADQEQQQLRQKLEAATERVKTVEVSHATLGSSQCNMLQ